MTQGASLARLLQYARLAVRLTNSRELLVEACREAAALVAADVVYACCAGSGTSWERGIHVAFSGTDASSPTPAARSALFAIHRQLARRHEAITLEPSAEWTAIFDAFATRAGAAARVVAVPVLHRTGRLVGQITICVSALEDGATALLQELAGITAAALENAHRYAFAKRDQERLLLLAEASEEALWDWTPESDELWWGGGIEDLLGQGRIAVQNRYSWKLERIHPDDAARVAGSMRRALDSAASLWREEFRMRRADDSWIVVEERGYFLREPDGRAYRVVGTLRNVSSLKALLQREQDARAQAENASRGKDEFLAMLSHELRNPLAPILTAVNLMRLRGVDAIERERTVIERQALHMIRLVDDLLDVARITKGKVELHRERVEVAVVVAKAIEMASPLIEERRHHLDLHVPSRGLAVDADPGRLAQVISNLLTNAAKYTDVRGRITVAAEQKDGSVELKVSDTGIGIAADMLPRVFDTFIQEGQSLARSQGGLGLGLSIVRSLVALHGGSVAVHSEGRGQGAEFTIRVPLAAPAEEVPAAVRSSSTPAHGYGTVQGRRILIVDDNEDAADLVAECLDELGNTTCVVHDGPAAVRVAREFAPELVLLDLGLPVLDGFEVAKLLREQFGDRRVRLIAVTGYGQEADRRRTAEAGFDAHLVKPVSLDLLEKTIRELSPERLA